MEKKNKIILILTIIIVILLIAIGIMFFIFKNYNFNENAEDVKENNIDWKTEYYNKLKDLEEDNEDIEYSFIYIENKKVPILVVKTNNFPKTNYDFYTVDSKVKKIGKDSFDINNQIDIISSKDDNYYFTSIKATNDETDIGSIIVNDIKIKKDKIAFDKKETLDVDKYKDDFGSSFEKKYGSAIKFAEISDYEFINDVKKDKESTKKEEVIKKESLIEYNKKYIADGTGEYDDGIYFIFYKNGKLEYSENMCEGYYHLDGTYKIDGERIIVNIPDALNGDGDWALKIIAKDKLKFDESYKKIDYVCGFAKGFVLE